MLNPIVARVGNGIIGDGIAAWSASFGATLSQQSSSRPWETSVRNPPTNPEAHGVNLELSPTSWFFSLDLSWMSERFPDWTRAFVALLLLLFGVHAAASLDSLRLAWFEPVDSFPASKNRALERRAPSDTSICLPLVLKVHLSNADTLSPFDSSSISGNLVNPTSVDCLSSGLFSGSRPSIGSQSKALLGLAPSVLLQDSCEGKEDPDEEVSLNCRFFLAFFFLRWR